MSRITRDELNIISRYICEVSGIYLDNSKAYLVETRLKSLLRETGSGTYYDLYRKAKSDKTCALEKKIIDAICTPETMFFRDNSPFELLKKKLLPELVARKSSSNFPANIRIWSAGCSTGQELYSIAMILRESLADSAKFRISLLGTDISDAAVSCASSGEYSQVTVERGLPPEKLAVYFRKNSKKWRIREDIRAMCTFRNHNLMDSFEGLGRFDIVFCRNVAIYFQKEDKAAVFKKIGDILEPDGFLIIGSSEAISGANSLFEPVTHSNVIFYRLKKTSPNQNNRAL